ncbi:MAG: adenylate/guanylate cyclase domain-containing protein, partial [Chlamydiota bacterium]
TLVRKLIKSSGGARIGVESKDLAIMFTDIEDFAGITEYMNPQELMIQLCDYFDEMSKIISQHHGTIDKYIGDSIMAFWGAPENDDETCLHACQAALACQDKLNSLNKHWKGEGKQPFFTRIGIHHGVTLVGNLGSKERINYSAIGDAPNTASRLEAINKVYHTQIVISESVYKDVKGIYQVRLLDQITVKGKYEPIRIYELISSRFDDNIEAYNVQFEEAFNAYQHQNWEKAIGAFEKALELWPEDHVAYMFLERCQYLQNNPPGEHWDGVWRYKTK